MKRYGHPPLPQQPDCSTQAVFNVLLGERYKIVTNEVKDYFRAIRKASGAPSEIQKKVIGDEEPIKDRPADYIEPGTRRPKRSRGHLYTKEDVLSTPRSRLRPRSSSRRGWHRSRPNLFEQSQKDHPMG